MKRKPWGQLMRGHLSKRAKARPVKPRGRVILTGLAYRQPLLPTSCYPRGVFAAVAASGPFPGGRLCVGYPVPFPVDLLGLVPAKD